MRATLAVALITSVLVVATSAAPSGCRQEDPDVVIGRAVIEAIRLKTPGFIPNKLNQYVVTYGNTAGHKQYGFRDAHGILYTAEDDEVVHMIQDDCAQVKSCSRNNPEEKAEALPTDRTSSSSSSSGCKDREDAAYHWANKVFAALGSALAACGISLGCVVAYAIKKVRGSAAPTEQQPSQQQTAHPRPLAPFLAAADAALARAEASKVAGMVRGMSSGGTSRT